MKVFFSLGPELEDTAFCRPGIKRLQDLARVHCDDTGVEQRHIADQEFMASNLHRAHG